MTADLHGSASLTVTGTADLLDNGRDPGAVDELRITAGLRRGGSVRLTAEIARYKGDDADEISVEFTADLDAATCGRLGRMLLALADEREPTARMVALPFGDSMRADGIRAIDVMRTPSGAMLTVQRVGIPLSPSYAFDDPAEAEAHAQRMRDEINGTSDDERSEFQSLAAYMLRSVGYAGAPLQGTQSAMRAIFDKCLADREAQNADALTVAVSRLTTEIDRGDKTREALGSALTQLRDLSTHAQLLLDLATEAVEIDPGTGEIVSTPRGTVERVKAAMAAMVELRKMVW